MVYSDHKLPELEWLKAWGERTGASRATCTAASPNSDSWMPWAQKFEILRIIEREEL